MGLNYPTPWHRASFDRFLHARLPELLAARLPLVGYRAEATSEAACRVTVTLAGDSGEVTVIYEDIPQPDPAGVVLLEGKRRVVVPVAQQDELDTAEIHCVGELLYDYMAARLGEAPAHLPWDEALARTWLPLDKWVREYLLTAPILDETNQLAAQTHLRRLMLKKRETVFTPGHIGRACPIETPEGPNIGQFLSIARGAEIREGRLVVTDERPEAAFGLSASLIPFLEYGDPARLLMGANMMRQWLTPPDPEPALVQTGNESDAPGLWCGRNLLTAYVSWGADTFEDALVISESCAKRLNYPTPIEPGDKLSNRHGTKGVVSRILPDDEMPHLPDGTPVEICYTFTGLHTRMNFGQMREAVLSRIARADGQPALAPPFHSPGETELRERLAGAGLPIEGIETLTTGKSGPPMPCPSTVGWVYWGRLNHLAKDKIHAAVLPGRMARDEAEGRDSLFGPFSQRQGALEWYALREAGAFAFLREQFNTRTAERPDADSLAARIAAGPVAQADAPTPKFAALVQRLAVAGIRAELVGTPPGGVPTEEVRLSFCLALPEGDTLRLARPVPHPWLRGHELSDIGVFKQAAEYGPLVEANRKLERLIASDAPESLCEKAFADLQGKAHAFFDALLTPDHVRPGAKVLFSGRAVITPGENLRHDQVGLPEEIVWTLFGPLLARELGSDKEVRARSKRAAQTLDKLLARAWVVINRAPTTGPASFVAFHPVRETGRVLRLHPSVNTLLNADYDGDQIAVFLPVTEAAQREVGERLSLAGHLRRDPNLLGDMIAWHHGLWGLARLSLTPEGREEIAEMVGGEVAAPEGYITKQTLTTTLRALLERAGVEVVLEALDRLQRRGFEAAKESGASISPFMGASLERPAPPEGDSPAEWKRYEEEIGDRIAARTDYANPDFGPALLAVKSGARGSLRHLVYIMGTRGLFTDAQGQRVPFPCGNRDGETPVQMFANCSGTRDNLFRYMAEWERMMQQAHNDYAPRGFNVLSRALRACYPGPVFAHAAAIGESDPLADLDARLFVGLPPLQE